ncbi:MAG: phosphate ABC transporter permease subunit PstC [Lachnospiraceae bacterium]|nr:phosphate ABC transporter permease subunit PstC [Lachnospiraceae bacterium]
MEVGIKVRKAGIKIHMDAKNDPKQNTDAVKINTIQGSSRTKAVSERSARGIFTICAFIAIAAVAAITVYMVVNGAPALFEVGIGEIVFGTEWKPTAQAPQYGILYVILTSIVGTVAAVLIGVPIGLLTAVFLAEVAPKKLVTVVKPAVELLAGIPSVIYGLLGLMVLNPLMYKLEMAIFKGSETHQFTGGSNLLSAILVLAVMILPTVINISESSLRAVPPHLKAASLSLGASHIQTVFKIIVPAARSGIITAVVLGVGRAIGEAMAITLVSGSAVNMPLPFNAVRFLTTAIVSEMGYASDLHRQVLFSIGLILFAFIMIINFSLTKVLKKGEKKEIGGRKKCRPAL